MDMSLQLFDLPGSPCDPNDRHVELTSPDHRLQGREDLLIGKVAGDAKEDETV
jgi:hypothetical protein